MSLTPDEALRTLLQEVQINIDLAATHPDAATHFLCSAREHTVNALALLAPAEPALSRAEEYEQAALRG